MKLSAEQVARIVHEANRAYCMSIGDHTIPTWDQAPPWQKDSCLAGVKDAMADPNRSPEASHEAWVAFKKKAGWKHGAVKRPEALEHPCMVPYAELPEEQRVKDHLFLAIIRAVTAGVSATEPPIPKPMAEEVTAPGGKKDDTQEVGIITEHGSVVKDAEIVPEVKPKRKKRGLLGG